MTRREDVAALREPLNGIVGRATMETQGGLSRKLRIVTLEQKYWVGLISLPNVSLLIILYAS